MEKKSNQDRSKEIAKLIRDWITERETQQDYAEWIQTSGPTAFKGVKRKKLATALGVSKTSLNENESSPELRNAEFRWCMKFLQKQEASKTTSAELSRAHKGERHAKKLASSLEENKTELIAENRILRSHLAKWESIEKILQETARAPRGAFTME